MSNGLSVSADLCEVLRCPDCRLGAIAFQEAAGVCTRCGSSFPLTSGVPILLRHDNSIFSINDYLMAKHEKPAFNAWRKFLPSPSVNLAAARVLRSLRAMLDANGQSSVLIVGGGRQRAWLDPLLRENQAHRVIYSDVDRGADVDLFCDGHDLPFVDHAFDAVITTAVLEHVLCPERVATEIARVLKPRGLLYSELPFMQQVHEGAFDFTRFTLSGHRRLFNSFSEIEVGMVAGPATALVWAIENLALAFFSRAMIRSIAKVGVRLLFGWIKYVDYYLIDRPQAMDGASCTYFLGSKGDSKVPDLSIVNRYVGAKPLRHV